MTSPTENDCRRVLAEFPAALLVSGEVPPRLSEIHSGLSGARVWRVDNQTKSWGLRKWPSAGPPLDRLSELHRWIGWLVDTGGLPLAKPCERKAGETWLEDCGGLWQLEPWLPGGAHLNVPADPGRVAQAMVALARLHQVSARYLSTATGAEWFAVSHGPSPAVMERLALLSEWTPSRLAEARDQLRTCADLDVKAGLLEIVAAARRSTTVVRDQLLDARQLTVPLFPCLRDARPDHVLFSGDQLTGMIDPAAARTDSAAVDLSRLLGGYLPTGPRSWSAALDCYAQQRRLSAAEHHLLPVLDISNALLSGLNWVDFCRRNPASALGPEQGRRVLELAERLERVMERGYGG